MKKIVKSLLTLVLLLIGFLFVNVDGNTVLAAETETEYMTEQVTISELGESKIPVCSDTTKEWLFAGWYEDAACEVAYRSFPTGETAYAKFVPEKVLSVKLQLTEDTDENSPTTNMRLVSSVDSLDYRKVGFKVYFNGAQTPVNIETTKVYERIVASAESGVEYNYSPKVVNTESEYFVTATLINISQGNFDKSFYIRPYWVTLDGTEVYGENRFVQVWHGYTKNVITIPIKGIVSGNEVEVTYGEQTATATVLKSADGDDAYSQLLINLGTSGDRTALKSVTTFNVGDLKTQYRNLLTSHVVAGAEDDATHINKDTSWYTETIAIDSDEKEFVIATSADLYGLTAVVNKADGELIDLFEGKTVYVVSDLVMNDGNMTTSPGWSANEGAVTYEWPMIGSSNGGFAGTFDGQGHTISGISKTASSTNIIGMFRTSATTTKIKNFKLTNSFLRGSQRVGSIIGEAVGGGEIDSVYSDAALRAGHVNFGGLVGRTNDDMTIKNCWYAGMMYQGSDRGAVGGLVGSTNGTDTTLTISNSLKTGKLYASKVTTATNSVGGLVGTVAANHTLNAINCLCAGEVASGATGGVGSLIGINNGTATFTTSFATTESCTTLVDAATTYTGVTQINEADIAGTDALTADTKNLFTYVTDTAIEGYWAVVAGSTPVLSDFAEIAGIENYIAIDTNWYNTEDSVFVLKDVADFYGFTMLSRLEAVSGFANKTVKLADDIVIPNEGEAADWATTAPDYQWLCIGTSTYPYEGTFDGQGYTISGLYLSNTSTYQGLFGKVSSATIQDFSLLNSYFKGGQQTGSVAGGGSGTFDTIYSKAYVTVQNTHNVGGIIGRAENPALSMNNCWFAGEVALNVTNSSAYGSVGGLIGRTQATTSTITNCMNSGRISTNSTGSSPIGGLVGNRTLGTLTITNCFNAKEIVYNSEDDTATNYGLVMGSGAATITNTYTISQEGVDFKYNAANEGHTLDATTLYGTAAMDNMSELFTLASADDVMYWAVTDYTPVLASFAEYATDAEGNAISTVAIDTSWYDASKDTYTLYDVSDLYGYAMLSKLADVNGFAGKTIKLGADIVVPNAGEAKDWATSAPKYNWNGIGADGAAFNGEFDGQGHSISGIYTYLTTKYIGFFRYAGEDAVIKNFSLLNTYIKGGHEFVGSIVGQSGADIDAVYSNAIVEGSRQCIGGFVGRATNGTVSNITNCWFAGSVAQTSNGTANVNRQYTGGFVGRAQGQVIMHNCLNSGDVSALNYVYNTGTTEEPIVEPYIGGFVGHSSSKVDLFECLNVGNVTVNDAATGGYAAIVGAGTAGYFGFTNVYALEGSCDNLNVENDRITIEGDLTFKTSEELTGGAAIESVKALFIPTNNDDGVYEVHWATVPGSTPVLANFVKYASEGAFVPDTTWYDTNESSYTLNDVADYYGFALLSKVSAIDGFAGKKVTLGADIDLNEGWTASATAPEYIWIGIGEYIDDSNIIPFKGEFDGNNKTIKGIYYNNTMTKYGGLFRLVEDATIKNFSLTNSYVASNRDFMGSITGQATDSSFEQIYSNAVVVGSRNSIGGLVGRISTGDASTSMVRCWYDGAVTNNGNTTSNRNTGGLVGRVNTDTTISNCLNTADVSAPNYAVTEKTDGTDNSVRPYIGGLVGFHSAGTMNLSYSLNTGKISFNEAATIGYGAVVGRVNNSLTVNALAAYGTTSSCSTAVSITTSNTVKPTITELELVNIVDAALMGAAAEDTKLFATENEGAWSIVDNAYPVLTCFADKATSGTAPTLSNVQTTVQANVGTVIAETVDSSSIAFTDNATVTRRQGGCYVVRDGKAYYYQSFIEEYYVSNPLSDNNGDGVVNNLDNKVVIVKYDCETNQEVVRSAQLELCHTNDMTYNSKLDLLVVAHANNDMHRVSFIDPDTLERVDGKYVDGLSYYNIDYNSTYDCYVVLTGAENGKGHGIAILNGNMEIIARYESDGLYTDPKSVDAGGAQGVGCDDKYIYCLFSNTDTGIHAITVFDWNGNYVTEISFTLDEEPESLSFVGNRILVNVAGESKIYQLVF